MRSLSRLLLFVLVLVLVLEPRLHAELPEARWKDAADQAERAARSGDEKLAAEALAAVAKDDSERAMKLIASTLARLPKAQEELYDAVFAALDALHAAPAVAAMKKELASGKDWRLRVVIVDVLGPRGKADEEAVTKALEDAHEEVVRAATRQIGRKRTEAGIRALCDAMAKLESKGKTAATWQDMRNALTRALGTELQGGADYKNYLEANKARFVEGRGIAPDAERAAAGGEGEKGGGLGKTVVFGTELACKSVVLVIDISGSMDMTDPYPEGMNLGSKERKYVQSNGMLDPDRKRITRAKTELTKLLDALAKQKGKINIIAFSTDVECWKKDGLVELGSANLASAKAFVKDLKADGVTCTQDALEAAFALAPAADCFYLFSDGKATNDGTHFIPARQIIEAVEKMNKLRKVEVNTFGFIAPASSSVEGADVELMSGLAEATGGTYTEIR